MRHLRPKRPTFKTLLRQVGMSAGLLTTLELIVVADELITTAKAKWPDHAPQLDKSFLLLQPTRPLRGKVVEVYQAHSEELLERVVQGQDTRPGTRAEVLCALLDGALKAPPTAAYGNLAEVLFQQVMPQRLEPTLAPEQWTGQHSEYLLEFRRVLAVPARQAR